MHQTKPVRAGLIALISLSLIAAVTLAPGLIAPVSAEIRRCPVNGPLGEFDDTYGDCRDDCARWHQGQDLPAAIGTELVAVGDGTIVATDDVDEYDGESDLGGITLWLQTDDGVAYYYAHNQENLVRAGVRVTAGQLIARSGNTGNAAGTVPHLHFEKHPGGRDSPPDNPYHELVAACDSPTAPPDLYEVVLQGTDLHATSGAGDYRDFIVHEALGERTLHPTTQPDWQFGVADYNRDGSPDFYAIKTRGGCGRTEVFVYDGADQFRANDAMLAALCTNAPPSSYLDPQGRVQSTTQWLIGDYNGDGSPDLWDVQTLGLSGQTEVHVWSGADGFRGHLLSVATVEGPLSTRNEHGEVTSSAQVSLVDYNGDGTLDVAWAQLHGASGTTELHVLDGATHFQTYLAHSPTLQGPGGHGVWKWIARDYNGDSRVDLVGIAAAGTGSGMTEVHVLDGATDYTTFIAHLVTAHGTNGLAGYNFYLPAP